MSRKADVAERATHFGAVYRWPKSISFFTAGNLDAGTNRYGKRT